MPPSHPIIVVQSICTKWTKTSRGGINATARNHTPTALELPALSHLQMNTHFILHELLYFERNSFQHPIEKLVQKEPVDTIRHNCLSITLNNGILNVLLEWERSKGIPRRLDSPRKGFSLQAHQWGRIIYNQRISTGGNWLYKKYILNIGLFSPSSPKVFLETRPTHTYTDMAQLR